MAVVNATTVQVKPDRFAEWLDNFRKVKPIMEKAGAKNVRVLVGLVAGEGTGSIIVVSEADDFASSGKVLDQAFADQEIVRQLTLGEGNPMAGWQSSMFLDVPL